MTIREQNNADLKRKREKFIKEQKKKNVKPR